MFLRRLIHVLNIRMSLLARSAHLMNLLGRFWNWQFILDYVESSKSSKLTGGVAIGR